MIIKPKKLIIACDGESASGKSTAAMLISKKYKLLLINSGLLYRYGSKLVIKHQPKNFVSFLNNKFKKVSYKMISKQNLHSEQISNHVATLAKNKKVREIVNKFQKKIIKSNKRICVEGRDIASKILAKSPKYDLAFYFKCNLKVASYRRWLDIKKKVPLKNVKKSLSKRTLMDKKRKNSPLIKVKDAILISTDKLSKKEVLSIMSKYVEKLN
jgi:CMP/dCMP kinase